ncbi:MULTISPECIES: competence protein CoiA [Vagococcus]|uniref:competence protein CoiA n=1 Tax=Vagococcus TaxID=2737 RepID=UPI000E51CF22|nr:MULTISPECIES: competence protein CoiA family protein [Vagococcus]RHH69965.1 hypothetical protein DW196_04130 [Vagococcus sp. AM17-17]
MLIAKNDAQQMISSHEAVKSETYYCPCCQNEVVLKKGKIKFPHFAHKTLSNCEATSEPETLEHLKGKSLIARNCATFGLAYELEVYLPEINQRADVLIQNKLAIEFQCSSLSIERLIERTTQYKKHDYQVFWVLGSRLGTQKHLTELKKHFIYFDCFRGYIDFCLLVEDNLLVVTYYLFSKNKKIVTRKKQFSLGEISLVNILTECGLKTEYLIQQPFEEMLNRRKQLSDQLLCSDNIVKDLQEYFYQHNLHLAHLPPYLYFPNFFHPLLRGEDIRIRWLTFEVLQNKKMLTYRELQQDVLENLPPEAMDDYANLGKHQVFDYCLSLYVSFLQEIKVVKLSGSNMLCFDEESVMNNEQFKKFFKKRSERLTLPLKYDMIIK